MNDAELMLQVILMEDAEKHGITIDHVQMKVDQYRLELRMVFDNGYRGSISTKKVPNETEALAAAIDLARSDRGRYQLWLSMQRAKEYAAGIKTANQKFGVVGTKISHFSDEVDADQFFTRKKGRTPGGRTYEVVDSPFGRRITVVDEAMQMAAQRGPFVQSGTKYFKLACPTAMNGNTSREKGWRRRARFWTEPRTKCRFLEAFLQEWNSDSEHVISLYLEGTHDPGAMYARARNVAMRACRISAGRTFPAPGLWKKGMKLSFPREFKVLRTGWGICYYDDSVVRAMSLAQAVKHLFEANPQMAQQFVARFEEVL